MAASSSEKPAASEAAPAQTEKQEKKPTAALEEDDEFEDFPAEDWAEEDTELPSGNLHLWEESWDDDEQTDDFSRQLREELKKTGGK